jgi:hypothetical protein
MNKNLLLTALVLFFNTSYAQSKKETKQVKNDKPLFPVAFLNRDEISKVSNNYKVNHPERKLEELIGEKFIVLPLESDDRAYYGLYISDKPKTDLYNKNLAGKKLSLISINASNTQAKFKDDSSGVEYTKQLSDKVASGFVSVSEFEAAKKAYTGTKIWVKRRLFNVKKDKLTRKIGFWEPVIISSISISSASYTPIRLALKTLKGEIGALDVDISGTNTNNEANSSMEIVKNRRFEDIFFDENPMTKYKLTPSLVKIVERGKIYLGIPSAAFRVIAGEPTEINTTTGSFGVHEQWVYVNNQYYYFENGVLTTVQN